MSTWGSSAIIQFYVLRLSIKVFFIPSLELAAILKLVQHGNYNKQVKLSTAIKTRFRMFTFLQNYEQGHGDWKSE